MSDQSQEIAALHVAVRRLTERIYHLEQVVSRLAPEPQAPEQPAPAPERAAEPPEPPRAEPWAYRHVPAQPPTPAPTATPPQAATPTQQPALQPPPPPRPPRDWSKLA